MERISTSSDQVSLAEQYRTVKAAFVLRGSSLNAWCRAQGIAQQNVRRAFTGAWSGPAAERLIAKVIRAATDAR